MRFRLKLSAEKKAMEVPSGENTGDDTPVRLSVPGMALACISPIRRRYRREFATYAIRAPSGEIAKRCCPVLVNCCPSASEKLNWVTIGAGGTDLNFHARKPAPAAPRTKVINAGSTRHQCLRTFSLPSGWILIFAGFTVHGSLIW